MRRIVYLSMTAVFALAAALLTLRAQHTVPVLFATHDLQVGAVIQPADLVVRNVHEDGATATELGDPAMAVSHYVVWPVAEGAPLLPRNVGVRRAGNPLAVDFALPQGSSAIAVPVNPAQAVGGVLAPGDRVDVYATPIAGHGDMLPGDPNQAITLGHDVVVLQLRDDQGNSLSTGGKSDVHGLNFGSGKLGSVVLAVPTSDVAKFAGAAADSSFYLSLSAS